MKLISPFHFAKMMFAAVCLMAAVNTRAATAFKLPTGSAAVDQAVSDESLRQAAAKTTDTQVLLGLAYLANVGSPVRGELLQKVVEARPDLKPIATVLTMAMDGNDRQLTEQLLQQDPDNALGHYLTAQSIYQTKRDNPLDEFKVGASLSEIRLYENTTADALFKALGALKLEGKDRLCASSWIASRLLNFRLISIQPFDGSLDELAAHADLAGRKEIAEMLLTLTGQLSAVDFESRHLAERAVLAAFRLKAETAYAENSPTAFGYVTAVRALTSVQVSWPGIMDKPNLPLEIAVFVPDRILEAFETTDPRQTNFLIGMQAKVPESDRPTFNKAAITFSNACVDLIASAVSNSDEVIGPFIRGLPPAKADATGPWKSHSTYVERLMMHRPEVFKATAALEKAYRALNEAGSSDPEQRNFARLMRLGEGIISYAFEHSNVCPARIDVILNNKKYADDKQEAKSVLTGKPYVYAAGGQKVPERHDESAAFIVLYDASPNSDGKFQCAMGDGHGEWMSAESLKKHLAAQGGK